MMPESFLERYKVKGETTFLFGDPVGELTRDELLACVGLLIEREEQAQKAHAQERRMTNLFREARKIGS